MIAAVMQEVSTRLSVRQVPDPVPIRKSEVIVRLRAAALNHRDLWIQQGLYAGIKTPVILGSDGAGRLGRRDVLINPSINWSSGAKHPPHPKKYKILGLPDDGTLAEYVRVPRQNVYPIPRHLSMEEAAALPLAGLTAYRVLFSRCKLTARDRVLINGIGGGVALMAFQYAVATGAETWVTSSSPAKIKKAIQLGAAGGIRYTEAEWDKKLTTRAGLFDVIIDSAAGKGFGRLVKIANYGARIGIYGGTTGPIEGLIPQIVFWKQLNILGSTMGNAREFARMLDFVSRHKIKPVIDKVYPLKQVNRALKRMQSGKQFGKIVIRIED